MSRIYFARVYIGTSGMKEFKGPDLKRRFHPHWSGPTPTNKKNYEPDPKIKNPKPPKPKKGGKKK